MKTPIEVLRETVKTTVSHVQRFRYDDATAEWLVLSKPLGSSNDPYLNSEESRLQGKLIVVERTITERIVGEYTINKDGSLTKDEL